MLVLCLSFGIVLFDQITKHLVELRIPYGHAIPVIAGFFDLSHVHNTGAAWGMLQGLNHWLVALSIVMLGMMIVFRKHFISDSLLSRVAAGLILGGIVGNLLDRLRNGHVVDFLDFHWGAHAFPAFNVADSAICVGVVLYMIFQSRHHENLPTESSADAVAVEEA
jgi:signal peptidase II